VELEPTGGEDVVGHEAQVGLARPGEERAEVDAVVRGTLLLGQHDHVPVVCEVTVEQVLHEPVSDHPVPGDDQPRLHDHTVAPARPPRDGSLAVLVRR
jgi:hypothetical protein